MVRRRRRSEEEEAQAEIERDEEKPRKRTKRRDEEPESDDADDDVGEILGWKALKQIAKSRGSIAEGTYIATPTSVRVLEPTENDEGEWRAGGEQVRFKVVEVVDGGAEEGETFTYMFRTKYHNPNKGQRTSIRINTQQMAEILVAALGEDFYDDSDEPSFAEMFEDAIKEKATFKVRYSMDGDFPRLSHISTAE